MSDSHNFFDTVRKNLLKEARTDDVHNLGQSAHIESNFAHSGYSGHDNAAAKHRRAAAAFRAEAAKHYESASSEYEYHSIQAQHHEKLAAHHDRVHSLGKD